MNKLLLAVALWVGLVGAGLAQTVEEQLLATLRSQGYVILEQGYTFLGRLRVVAENAEIRREIVVNPGTGEILRDYAVLLTAIAASRQAASDAKTLSSSPVQGTGSGAPDDPAGIASTSQPVGGATVSQTDSGSGEPVEGRMNDGTETDDLLSPEMILVDPILFFKAGRG